MKATGQCLCGAVRFTAESVDTEIHGCHCNMCRRWSGGPGLAVKAGSVDFDGEDHITRYPSSDWAERGFCKACGSHLFYFLKPASAYMLWAGSFDDPSPFNLAGEIYIDEKPPGYAFAGEHPRLTGEEFLASIGEQ